MLDRCCAKLDVVPRIGLLDTSVMRYITRQRLETAKLLLQTSALSVQEISRLVGYESASHFSRRFHDYEGLSPLKFRQQKAHDEDPDQSEI